MDNLRQILALLTLSQRRQARKLLGLMVLGSLVETAGVGLIIPALALMAETNIEARYPRLLPLLEVMGNPTQAQLIVGGMIALFGLYFLKTFFLAFLAWKQNAFVFGVRADISQRLFAGFLAQPWSFHLQRNSAQLINILATETNQFTGSG